MLRSKASQARPALTECVCLEPVQSNVLPDAAENIQGPDNGPGSSRNVPAAAFETDADVIRDHSSPEMTGLAMIAGTISHRLDCTAAEECQY